MFHEATEQQPIDTLIRLLDVETSLAPIALNYFKDYTIVIEDLQDERWAIRVWKAKLWIEGLQRHFFTRSLKIVRPDLWASDDPNHLVDTTVSPYLSGNQNLMHFLQKSCLLDGTVPRLDELQFLNNGLRERARTALISYLCAMQRIEIGRSFASTPKDLSSLLLQDVQVGLGEESSRIEDAISAIQTFVQRARIGLEPLHTISVEFGKAWDGQFATFDTWGIHQRRLLYSENWVQWEELKIARKSEAFRFFERQLKRKTISMPVPNAFLPYAADTNYLPVSGLEIIQSSEYASLNPESSTVAQNAALIIGQPDRDGQLSLLAPVETSSSSSGNVTKQPTSGSPTSSTPNVADVALSPLQDSAPEVGKFPLWFQAAIRLGTSFIRVAAAGVPPAISGESDHFVMDEYYFWLVEGKKFSQWDMVQNADIGMNPSDPSSSSWDPPTVEGEKVNFRNCFIGKCNPDIIYFGLVFILGCFNHLDDRKMVSR